MSYRVEKKWKCTNMAFAWVLIKKQSVTDILFVLVTLCPPSIHYVSKIIYMYKVFLSLLTHLFESSSLAIYIPHWRQTFLTARKNFYNKKNFTFCYEIIPNFRYTVIPWKVSEAESILIWVMISLCFWFTQLLFQKISIILSPNQK